MEPLQRAFEPYRHLDPEGWVGLYRYLPLWGGLVCLGLGVLMLLFGGGRLFRLVAAPVGALVATLWAATLATRFGFQAHEKMIVTVATVALGAGGLLLPPVVLFFAFGVPTGLAVGTLVGNTDWLLGFAPGFMVGGALGVVLHRPVSAVLSAAVGGWVFVLGLLASVTPFTSVLSVLVSSPVTAVCLAGACALAGSVYQLFVRPAPEEAAEQKRQRVMEKKKKKEQADLERRWANYTGPDGKKRKGS